MEYPAGISPGMKHRKVSSDYLDTTLPTEFLRSAADRTAEHRRAGSDEDSSRAQRNRHPLTRSNATPSRRHHAICPLESPLQTLPSERHFFSSIVPVDGGRLGKIGGRRFQINARVLESLHLAIPCIRIAREGGPLGLQRGDGLFHLRIQLRQRGDKLSSLLERVVSNLSPRLIARCLDRNTCGGIDSGRRGLCRWRRGIR